MWFKYIKRKSNEIMNECMPFYRVVYLSGMTYYKKYCCDYYVNNIVIIQTAVPSKLKNRTIYDWLDFNSVTGCIHMKVKHVC